MCGTFRQLDISKNRDANQVPSPYATEEGRQSNCDENLWEERRPLKTLCCISFELADEDKECKRAEGYDSRRIVHIGQIPHEKFYLVDRCVGIILIL